MLSTENGRPFDQKLINLADLSNVRKKTPRGINRGRLLTTPKVSPTQLAFLVQTKGGGLP
jgi:hypothetical protein